MKINFPNQKFIYPTNQDTLVKLRLDSANKIPRDTLIIKKGAKKPVKAIIQGEKIKKDDSANITDSANYLIDHTQNSIYVDFINYNKIEPQKDFISILTKTRQAENKENLNFQKEQNPRISKTIVERNTETNNDLVFAIILLTLILLSLIVNRYRKYFTQLFESTIFKFTANRLINTTTTTLSRLMTILDILYFITISILIFMVIKSNDNLVYYKTPLVTILLIITGLIGIRIYKYLVHQIISFTTGYKEFIKYIFQNGTLFTRAISIIITPLVFFAYYTQVNISEIIVYISLGIVIIALIMKTIRVLNVFVENGFSIFYFILYLCALEIIPLLAIWKGVRS